MTSKTEPRAAAQVCAIPELLENILLNVEPFKLFTLQSVNSTFQDLIQNTKSLRRRMCLEPSVDREKVAQLLQEPRIRKVTHPFRISLHHGNETSGVPRYFNFELQCAWVAQMQRELPDETTPPRADRFECMGGGNWRKIKIGDPGGSTISADLSCEDTMVLENTLAVSCDADLGSATARMVKKVQRSWFDVCCMYDGDTDT
ncbi:hypothetical protein CLAFUW4_10846 [Fulvia fulva]|uniref:F-box domain-containing protein n=1 Tax=Passalora fulva TaxID=5499 RepID=A0A9Q8PCJ1_PASFU|nr:uncharacterized protein CLAFUR5_09889 [Fulvia fulva]KAK4619789.1 hypothetical protein CLAFUR4_10851 [Fulvia fulva]KAK4620312.1 hypothetical protein CLAFUR0_10858 [Fulvia fulva]UJO19921.1 hypothetical protein CLAFUR5_09889 [Fulvia fulva]WPV17201.1 hypothetical protein CLAFUW4_10846 [Fulvia fulva]WPV32311.1 hypothetical protein CLAFUW7_10844 [Fulvia fulva]